jgi:hypothetical protein
MIHNDQHNILPLLGFIRDQDTNGIWFVRILVYLVALV